MRNIETVHLSHPASPHSMLMSCTWVVAATFGHRSNTRDTLLTLCLMHLASVYLLTSGSCNGGFFFSHCLFCQWLSAWMKGQFFDTLTRKYINSFWSRPRWFSRGVFYFSNSSSTPFWQSCTYMQYARGESNIKVGPIQRQRQAHIQWCCCRFRADGHHSLVAILNPHHQNQHLKYDRQRHN